MKYGKRFREEVERKFPEWKSQFMSYKELKQKLKLYGNYKESRFSDGGLSGVDQDLTESIAFTQLLDSEVNKVISFYFDKEEDYIIRLKEIQIRAANVKSKDDKLEVQMDILQFHAEMVLLLHYSDLNFTGLIKIVKKHNKRTGTCFQFSAMEKVMQQPFFSTGLLYQLMEECQIMLARLFSDNDHGRRP